MSILKLPYITLDGKEYQIVVIDDDIVLQGLHDDRELTKGWPKLMDECRESVKYNHGFWPSDKYVKQLADENLYDYVLRNYKDAVIVQHNVN